MGNDFNKEPEIPNFEEHKKNVEFNRYVESILAGSVKSKADDKEVPYVVEKEVITEEKAKKEVKKTYLNLKKVLVTILSGTLIAGSVAGIGLLGNEMYENNKDDKTRDCVSVLLIDHTMGRDQKEKQPADYYNGNNYWYDYDKLVEAIIKKGSYKDSELLYLQFGRIYNGLKNEDNLSKISISKLYGKLREKVLENDKIEIGPESFDDWLKSIGKYTEGIDNLEVMYQSYLDWFYSTREEVVNDQGTYEILIGDKIFVITEAGQVQDCYEKIDYGIRI